MRKSVRTSIPAIAGAFVLGAASLAGAGTAYAGESVTALPITGFSDLAVDDVLGHVFVSGGAESQAIVATGLDGTGAQEVADTAGAASLAVSPDGSTLYAAVPASGEILAIDASTLQVTHRYELGAGTSVTSLAVAGGELWLAWTSKVAHGLGTLTLDGTLTQDVQSSTGSSAQVLAGTPVPSDELAVAASAEDGVKTYQVVGGALQAQGRAAGLGVWTQAHLQLTPDGKDLALWSQYSNLSPRRFAWWVTAPAQTTSYLPTLTHDPVQPYGTGRTGINSSDAIAPDGTLASYDPPGDIDNEVVTEDALGRHLGGRLQLPSGFTVPVDGLAWASDSNTLYAVEQDSAGHLQLAVETEPKLVQIALAGGYSPFAVTAGEPYRLDVYIGAVLDGIDSGPSTYPGNGTVSFTLVDQDHPDGTPVQGADVGTGGFQDWEVTGTVPIRGTFSIRARFDDPAGGFASVTRTFAPEFLEPNGAVIRLTSVTGSTGPTGVFTRGKSITFAGVSSLAGIGTRLPGRVDVMRSDAQHPGGVAVGTAIADSAGRFTFTDTPEVGGSVDYRFTYETAGTNLTPRPTDQQETVSRAASALSMKSDRSSYAYGATATVTAHLGTTYNGRTVSIYAQPAGGTKTLVKTGTVDSHGNLAGSYKVTRATAFTAVFAGDYQYAPATATWAVHDYAKVSEAQAGYYTSTHYGSTLYRVYHHTAKAQFNVAVAPNKYGQCVVFRLQKYYSGSWHTQSTSGCHTLSSTSTSYLKPALTSGEINGKFRMAAEYVHSGKDTTNLNTWSAWQYFTVRK